jgi:hypothetical protein
LERKRTAMKDRISRLPGEPIIIFQPSDNDPAPSQETFARTAALMDEIGTEKVYRIIDLTEVQANVRFGDMVQVMAQETSGAAGSASDPRMRDVMVSTSDLLKLAAKSMGQQQYLGREIPLFPSVDEALAYIRGELAK